MNKKRPIVGVSGNIMIDGSGMFPGYERAYVNCDYIESVTKSGGMPYILPMVYDEEIIRQQVKGIDALILSGGYDIDPLMWGEEPHQKLGMTMPKRDTYDFKLFQIAKEMKKPILGICRGFQVINVSEGGSLYQDLSLKEDSYVKHVQGHTPELATHSAFIEKSSKFNEIFGCETIFVNSFHHLALNEVPETYKAAVLAKDGVVEGIEFKGDQFIIGTQFHPEMMTAKGNEQMQKLFIALIEEAKKNI